MEVAGSLGFQIPDTLITSDSAAAQKFIADRPATIIKSSANIFPHSPDGDPTMFYSKIVHPHSNIDLSGLSLAPAIFQQIVEPLFEVRVTVVEDKVFSAAIHIGKFTDDMPGVRDWRPAYYFDKLDVELYRLPKDLEQKCVELVKRLGLAYGAIDLIYDKNKQFWFLENNPNGQWAFVEQRTGQQIGKEIAKSLSMQRKSR
jgi:hypothetical protein